MSQKGSCSNRKDVQDLQHDIGLQPGVFSHHSRNIQLSSTYLAYLSLDPVAHSEALVVFLVSALCLLMTSHALQMLRPAHQATVKPSPSLTDASCAIV